MESQYIKPDLLLPHLAPPADTHSKSNTKKDTEIFGPTHVFL